GDREVGGAAQLPEELLGVAEPREVPDVLRDDLLAGAVPGTHDMVGVLLTVSRCARGDEVGKTFPLSSVDLGDRGDRLLRSPGHRRCRAARAAFCQGLG